MKKLFGDWFLVLGSWKILIPKHQSTKHLPFLHSSFPKFCPKYWICSLVLVPDETKIKGQKGQKGPKGPIGSQVCHREGSISLKFKFPH